MTAVRSLADIRADLEQAEEDLERLKDGDLTWDAYRPELANRGCMQDLAVEDAGERVDELHRELAYATTTGEK